MQYRYGANVRLVAPTGRVVAGQVGDWNDGDPIIHVAAYQIEAPSGILAEEGWEVPTFEAEGVASYAVEATEIVQALLSEDDPPVQAARPPERAVGREEPKSKSRPHCKVCGSYAHSEDKCPMEGVAVI